jgi:hypothetical protein
MIDFQEGDRVEAGDPGMEDYDIILHHYSVTRLTSRWSGVGFSGNA